jgi:hypothetical protein
MSDTNISLSDVSNASVTFAFQDETVIVQFVNGRNSASEPRRFTRLGAVEFGKRVAKSGDWEGIPFDGIDTSIVRALGKRLREFALMEPQVG